MKKIRLIRIIGVIGLMICFFCAKAENTILEEKMMHLNEEHLEQIRKQVGLPEDYDINRAMRGMDYLIYQEGFSIPGAAGLIGNGYVESRLLINPGKGYYKGLFQWDGKNRWPKVKCYLEENGADFEDEEELFMDELEAAIHSEDGENYAEVIEYCMNCESAEKSAERWCRSFEGVTQALSKRKKIARLTLGAYNLYYREWKREKSENNRKYEGVRGFILLKE